MARSDRHWGDFPRLSPNRTGEISRLVIYPHLGSDCHSCEHWRIILPAAR
ncbi:MAG: hypothetical protein R2865_09915 [Deinococcales bacterium]